MDYTVKEPLWQFVDHWQTLIAGLLAVLAAFGTVWATIKSANREIAAAQAQTNVAQDQIATTLRIEHRRTTREACAFYVTLEAALTIALEDIAAARIMVSGSRDPFSPLAYDARQRIRRLSFPELRSACLRLGGDLTQPFLSLDNKIDTFAAQWQPARSPTGGLEYRTGKLAGFVEELDQVELEAKSLREEASAVIKRCLEELA